MDGHLQIKYKVHLNVFFLLLNYLYVSLFTWSKRSLTNAISLKKNEIQNYDDKRLFIIETLHLGLKWSKLENFKILTSKFPRGVSSKI